jgi:hypothetical protein
MAFRNASIHGSEMTLWVILDRCSVLRHVGCSPDSVK